MGSRLATLAAVALALVQVGCSTPCQELGGRVCSCQPLGVLRDNCNSVVKTLLGAQNPSRSDEKFCQDRLTTCPDPEKDSTACQFFETADGKAACGLAFPQE